MRQSTRLILNTLITYGRMGVTVGIGLVTTRYLLKYLGGVDFGLLALLGSTGALLAILSDALTLSTQRGLAYEIGRDDRPKLHALFSTSVVLFLAAALLMGLLGMALAPWIVALFDIPPGRETAAWWVFQFSVLSIMLTVLATPFRAMLYAHQAMFSISLVEIVTSVGRLAAVFSLLLVPMDRLVAFALLAAAVVALTSTIEALTAMIRYPQARPRLTLFSRSELRELTGFAGWSFINEIIWRLRMQGAQPLLNLFFGPVVNAAYHVATQVAGYQGRLGFAIQRAVQPAIVSTVARDDHRLAHDLALVTSKYLAITTSFLLIPVILHAETILQLWLGDYPPYAAIFVRLVPAWMWLAYLVVGHHNALLATGRIAGYTLYLSAFHLAVLLIAPVLFWFGAPPWSMSAISILFVAAQSLFRVIYVCRKLDYPVHAWFARTLAPVALVLLLGLAAALLTQSFFTGNLAQLLAAFLAYALIAIPATWFLALQSWERAHFLRLASALAQLPARLRSRLRGGSSSSRHEPI